MSNTTHESAIKQKYDHIIHLRMQFDKSIQRLQELNDLRDSVNTNAKYSHFTDLARRLHVDADKMRSIMLHGIEKMQNDERKISADLMNELGTKLL